VEIYTLGDGREEGEMESDCRYSLTANITMVSTRRTASMGKASTSGVTASISWVATNPVTRLKVVGLANHVTLDR
jgi:hypothetical protein